MLTRLYLPNACLNEYKQELYDLLWDLKFLFMTSDYTLEHLSLLKNSTKVKGQNLVIDLTQAKIWADEEANTKLKQHWLAQRDFLGKISQILRFLVEFWFTFVRFSGLRKGGLRFEN